jgi:hypothetical protein
MNLNAKLKNHWTIRVQLTFEKNEQVQTQSQLYLQIMNRKSGTAKVVSTTTLAHYG